MKSAHFIPVTKLPWNFMPREHMTIEIAVVYNALFALNDLLKQGYHFRLRGSSP
jgi:hypothetical protein